MAEPLNSAESSTGAAVAYKNEMHADVKDKFEGVSIRESPKLKNEEESSENTGSEDEDSDLSTDYEKLEKAHTGDWYPPLPEKYANGIGIETLFFSIGVEVSESSGQKIVKVHPGRQSVYLEIRGHPFSIPEDRLDKCYVGMHRIILKKDGHTKEYKFDSKEGASVAQYLEAVADFEAYARAKYPIVDQHHVFCEGTKCEERNFRGRYWKRWHRSPDRVYRDACDTYELEWGS